MTTPRRRGRGTATAAIIASGSAPQRLLAAAIMARALEDAAGDLVSIWQYPHESNNDYALRRQSVTDDAMRWLREDAHVWCALMETPDVWEDMLLERIAA